MDLDFRLTTPAMNAGQPSLIIARNQGWISERELNLGNRSKIPLRKGLIAVKGSREIRAMRVEEVARVGWGAEKEMNMMKSFGDFKVNVERLKMTVKDVLLHLTLDLGVDLSQECRVDHLHLQEWQVDHLQVSSLDLLLRGLSLTGSQ